MNYNKKSSKYSKIMYKEPYLGMIIDYNDDAEKDY